MSAWLVQGRGGPLMKGIRKRWKKIMKEYMVGLLEGGSR